MRSFYLTYSASHSIEEWQIKSISEAVKKADSKDVKFIDHEKVVDWLMTWGHDGEEASPSF